MKLCYFQYRKIPVFRGKIHHLKTFMLLALFLFSGTLMAQNRIHDQVQEAKSNNIDFQTVTPFELSSKRYAQPEDFYNAEEVHLLEYQQNSSQWKGRAISFDIPLGRSTATIDLVAVPDSFYDYQLVTSDGKQHEPNRNAKHYRGVIRGEENSLVALSFFEKDVMGFISNNEGNYNIGKLKDADEFIIYNDNNLRVHFDFECDMPDDIGFIEYDPNMLMEPYDPHGQTRAFETNCVGLYFETEFDIFQSFGTVPGVENYVTALYNQVAIIYYNEGIDTTISMINVWNTADPYTATNTASLLTQFQNNTGAFTGDLGQLLTFRNAGGGRAAGFDGICNPNTDLSLSVSANLSSTVTNVPTYSWNVMVVTHEFGHLFGSRHTHACVWNGNNTAIDGCSSCQENPNPNIPGCNFCPQPPVPANGGTIMSYCHIQPVGINFNLGFGLQPGNVLRDNVANGSCLGDCSPCPIVSGSFDLYTKDRPFDIGLEPNPDTGPMWISEDIWVRQSLDGGTTPQNPEFKESEPNGVYVKIRNRGTTTSDCAVLKVYFSKASTGLQWPVHFDNFYQNVGPNSVLHGDIIGTAIIPSIAPGADITMEIPWWPPDPDDYINDKHHFCLVSRIISPNDPMFNEAVGSVSPNARNNNNIAWKNVSVYNADPNDLPPPQSVFIRGINEELPLINVRFFDRGFNERIRKRYFDVGHVLVKMDYELFERLLEYGSLEGEGIEIVDEAVVKLTSPEAAFMRFPLEYRETFSLTFKFELFREIERGEQILFDVVQENYLKREFEGGERFLIINDPEQRSADAESQARQASFSIVPNPNSGIFDLRLDAAEEGTYEVYDFHGNTIASGTTGGKKQISVNLWKKKSGIYFVRVTTPSINMNKILVLE
ncbi:M12 family metallo-peptidase [Aureisphaera galaxeae]|uniref:M12 family metallo-peptidase n=1 Tax=Aureisphaera galaxeae TaxID=1538023 RepID=UPI002350E951|nr:M12 family metallo-peptidase [Aureisphaera galaxeae]MDC8005338.1 M12 family metallo-peptidase [Aureisphaera galaxeae]